MLATLQRLVALSGLGFLLSLGACGGSSSETPPPLQPLPVNVHYDRSATTLPGELGMPVSDGGADPSQAPDIDAPASADSAAPPTWGTPGPKLKK